MSRPSTLRCYRFALASFGGALTANVKQLAVLCHPSTHAVEPPATFSLVSVAITACWRSGLHTSPSTHGTVRLYVEMRGSPAALVPLLVRVLLGGTGVCVWPKPALLRGIEVPIPALLRALAVPRDLTGTIQSNRHYSTCTTEDPVLYSIYRYSVVSGNAYALSGRHCGPQLSSLK